MAESVPEDPEVFSVWIVYWTVSDEVMDPQRFDFGTQAELDAFIKGVESSNGYLAFQAFDGAEEAQEAFRTAAGRDEDEDDEDLADESDAESEE